MCCYHSWQAKKKALAEYGDRKTRTCWKVIHFNGQAAMTAYQYAPGVHRAEVNKYNRKKPRGIHVYWIRGEVPLYVVRGKYIVPVICHRDDLVVASQSSLTSKPREAVFRKITIRRKAWERCVSVKRFGCFLERK